MMASLAIAGCGDADDPGPGPVPPAPQTPFWDDPACLPTDDPARSPSHQLVDSSGPHPLGSQLGAAVDVALFGPADDDAKHADVVVGAPGFDHASDRTGQVRLVNIDRATGEWSNVGPHRAEQEIDPPLAGVHAFGRAVLAANVHPTRLAAPPGVPEPDRLGRGHELFVGAPMSSASSGTAVTGDVFVYATRVDGDAYLNTDDRSDWQWDYAGVLDHAFGANARFGHSLATSRRHGPDDLVPWIAVGAPGANTVSIYEVTVPGASNIALPELVQQITHSSISGLGSAVLDFGYALAADDFNQDGILDLAIGAPGGLQQPARVIIVPGIEVGSPPVQRLDPLNATLLQPTFSDSPPGDVSRFGAALDAGDLFAPLQTVDPNIHFARSLAIGAPRHINAGPAGRGGVCWIAFAADPLGTEGEVKVDNTSTNGPVTDQPRCMTSPFDVADGDFGTAVAIADVSPVDALLSDETVMARTHELVVGAPGIGEIQWSPPDDDGAFTFWTSPPAGDPGPVETGTVVIFRGNPQKGPYIYMHEVERQERSLAERVLRPDVTEAKSRFGSAIRALDAQRTGRPDLVIGAPNWNEGRGAAQLLNSSPENGADGDLHGMFVGADSAMELLELRMVETDTGIYVRIEEPLTVSFVDDGTVCLLNGGIAATATFPLNAKFEHELLGPPTTKTLLFEATGLPIDEDEFDPLDYNDFEALRLDLTLTDRFFDNPAIEDQLEFRISNFEVWYCNDWRDPQKTHGVFCYGASRMIEASCTINNNPFHFDRDALIVETCE